MQHFFWRVAVTQLIFQLVERHDFSSNGKSSIEASFKIYMAQKKKPYPHTGRGGLLFDRNGLRLVGPGFGS